MKKRLISVLAAGIIGASSVLMPVIAGAEAGTNYISKSDFNDVSVGGAKGTGYYGLGIIVDGSPWLQKGSASVHYQTFYHDDQRNVNYCNMYSNSDKSGSGDGAGSMYFYNRNNGATNQMGPYGMAEFDIRMKSDSGSMQYTMGWFEDPTSKTYNANTDLAVDMVFSPDSITCKDGSSSRTLANIKPDKWYTVRITLDNKLEEYNAVVTDVETGKVIGKAEAARYVASLPSTAKGIKTTCWGYIRGNTYNYDLTNVTISKADEAFPVQ